MQILTGQKYAVRKLERRDLQGLAVLIKSVFGIEITEKYLEWKYLGGPGGRAVSTIGLSGDEVIGFHGAVPVRFSVNGTEIMAVEETDFAISQPHRRLDLYLNMIGFSAKTFREEKIGFTFGISSKNTSELNQSLVGKKQIDSIPRLVRVINSRPFIEMKYPGKILLGAASPIANLALFLKYNKKNRIPEGMEIKRLDQFDARFDLFWDHIKKEYPVTAVRDAAYLNWRYADPANNKYGIFGLEYKNSREIAGLIVLGENKEDRLLRGQILEIIAPEGDKSAAACLLRFAVDHFRHARVDAIECWMFSHNHMHPELVKNGFVSRAKKYLNLHFQNVSLGDYGASEEILKKNMNWFISLGDSDAG